MKKILYFMHIDWKWIKQRPQFLAEELIRNNQVLVIYPFSNRRKYLQKNRVSYRVPKLPLPVLPYASKFEISSKINNIIHKLVITITVKLWKPDYIWLTYPNNIKNVSEKIKTPIIYDCMDNYKDMTKIEDSRYDIIKNEHKIVNRSALIFCSSKYLAKRIASEYKISNKKIKIIRNGYDGKTINLNSDITNKNTISGNFKIGYIGTVSHWFDWENILLSLNAIDNIEYNIIGPLEINAKIPEHSRIIYHGVVAHEDLYMKVIDYDCLCMPFIVDDIIKAVDPVKLYEYINFNKNIMCVYYDEISRFRDYVYFYENSDQYIENLKNIIDNNVIKYSEDMRTKFLYKNTWTERVLRINENLWEGGNF